MSNARQGYYVRPDFFDWGIYKPYGELILFATGLLYLASFAACVLMIRRMAERIGYPRVGLVAGLIGLWPMVAAIFQSLDVQQSSRHYQELVHIPALIRVGVTVALVAILWVSVEGVRCRRRV
jgi:hypothetical protein